MNDDAYHPAYPSFPLGPMIWRSGLWPRELWSWEGAGQGLRPEIGKIVVRNVPGCNRPVHGPPFRSPEASAPGGRGRRRRPHGLGEAPERRVIPPRPVVIQSNRRIVALARNRPHARRPGPQRENAAVAPDAVWAAGQDAGARARTLRWGNHGRREGKIYGVGKVLGRGYWVLGRL